MSLFDIYKAKTLGAGAGSLFDAKAGAKLNKDAWKKGFNKWDEQWETGGLGGDGEPTSETNKIRSMHFIPCTPNTKYYVRTSLTTDELRLCYYDAEYKFISITSWLYNGVITTPINAYYMKLATSGVYGNKYQNDICINISGEHDGEYVPYNG